MARKMTRRYQLHTLLSISSINIGEVGVKNVESPAKDLTTKTKEESKSYRAPITHSLSDKLRREQKTRTDGIRICRPQQTANNKRTQTTSTTVLQ